MTSASARFPDLTNAYDPQLRALLAQAAAETGVPVRSGRLRLRARAQISKRPAEIRMFRDAEPTLSACPPCRKCIAARHCGMKVAALSLVTNLAAGLSDAR